MKIFNKVLVAGTFDNFHIGHQFFLWQSATMAECLTIIIARDINVRKLKKRFPSKSEDARMERIVQEAIPQATVRLGRSDGDFFQTIREENPNALLLGYDQQFSESACGVAFPEIKIIKLEPYFPDFFKSSKF